MTPELLMEGAMAGSSGDVPGGVWGFLGVVVTSVFAFLLAKFGGTQSTAAGQAETKVGERRDSVDGWDRLTRSYAARLRQLEQNQARHDRERREDAGRIGALETELRRVKMSLHSLRRRYVTAVRHIRSLRLLWAEAVRAGVLPVLPPVPDVLAVDVDEPPDLDYIDPMTETIVPEGGQI